MGLRKDYLVNIGGACLCTVVVVVDVNFYSFCLSEVGYVWRRLSWQAGTLSKRKKADEEGRRLCNCAQQIVRGTKKISDPYFGWFGAYLIFVTDTTDGVCVKKNCPV